MMRDFANRALISYAHLDEELCSRISKTLRELGLAPWSDKDLAHGRAFTEEIKTAITHAHVFIPILTPQSHTRGWVHQEIGYAVAMKVPCVPICVGASTSLPEGMIAMLHAVELDDRLSGLHEELAKVQFNQLIVDAGRQWIPPFACASHPEDRAKMIESLSDEAHSRLRRASCVRIRAALSSFSLPDQPSWHPSWKARYSDYPRTHFSYEWFRRERKALERHAASCALKMILYPGLDVDRLYGVGAKRTRLSVLLHFLKSLHLPEDDACIVFANEQPSDHIVAVGDWFIADSLGDRVARGVKQTVFTAHAPTVSRRIDEFDDELTSLMSAQGLGPRQSLNQAIDKLQDLIEKTPAHPDWAGY